MRLVGTVFILQDIRAFCLQILHFLGTVTLVGCTEEIGRYCNHYRVSIRHRNSSRKHFGVHLYIVPCATTSVRRACQIDSLSVNQAFISIVVNYMLNIIVALPPFYSVRIIGLVAHRKQRNSLSAAILQILQNVFIGITTVKMVWVIEYVMFRPVMNTAMKPQEQHGFSWLIGIYIHDLARQVIHKLSFRQDHLCTSSLYSRTGLITATCSKYNSQDC